MPSPCISVCRMDAVSGLCEGCFRTLDEIAAWGMHGRRRAARRVAAAGSTPRPGAGMKQITFHLDFISPYAYLAFEKLPQALQGLSYSVDYRPVLFAGLLKHHGQLGPGGDRAQARLDLPAGAVAGARARHPAADCRRRIPSTRWRCCGWRWPAARSGLAQPLCLRDDLPPRLARWRRCGGSAAPARSCRRCCSRSATLQATT